MILIQFFFFFFQVKLKILAPETMTSLFTLHIFQTGSICLFLFYNSSYVCSYFTVAVMF